MKTSAKIRPFASEWTRVMCCSGSGVTPDLQEAEGLATDTLAGHFEGRRVVLANTAPDLIAQFTERYLLVCLLPLRK